MATKAEGLDKVVAESSFVFKATVTRLNASNEPAVPAGPGLIVARVDAAFRASASVGLGDLSGREVTILLAGHEVPVLGDQLLFYANDWIYGTQIALREVAHHDATAKAEKEAIEAVERLPVRHLESRLDGAALVIEGKVESIGPSPVKERASFHSPLWKLAVVRVESTLKGKHDQEHVSVLFPTSAGREWAAAPRLKEHQQGIFILRHEASVGAPPHVYNALDREDVQPREQLRHLKSLLKG